MKRTSSTVTMVLAVLWTLLAASVLAEEKQGLAEANKFVERANTFVKNNSLQRAKSEYQKALKIFPQHFDALYNLAVVCEKLGETNEAMEHYKHYLELKPDDA